MPASMMMPPAGSMLSVSGSSSAMVAAGPSPGMMPTIVPRKQPTKHQKRLVGCSATANPWARPETISISEPQPAGRQRNAERNRERQVKCERGECCGCGGFEQRPPEHECDDGEGEQGEAQHEAERFEQRGSD